MFHLLCSTIFNNLFPSPAKLCVIICFTSSICSTIFINMFHIPCSNTNLSPPPPPPGKWVLFSAVTINNLFHGTFERLLLFSENILWVDVNFTQVPRLDHLSAYFIIKPATSLLIQQVQCARAISIGYDVWLEFLDDYSSTKYYSQFVRQICLCVIGVPWSVPNKVLLSFLSCLWLRCLLPPHKRDPIILMIVIMYLIL